MALPHRPSGVDAQVPAMRGGVYRAVHRRRRFRLNRPMDPNFDAGVLFDVAGLSCRQTLAWALQGARIFGFLDDCRN